MKCHEEFIVSQQDVCNGLPIIKGTRVRLKVVLDNLAEGHAPEEILKAYPGLTHEAVSAVIAYHYSETWRFFYHGIHGKHLKMQVAEAAPGNEGVSPSSSCQSLEHLEHHGHDQLPKQKAGDTMSSLPIFFRAFPCIPWFNLLGYWKSAHEVSL